jgi:ATP-dependent DNA helicase RecQ
VSRVAEALQRIFGFTEFRPNQREIVEAILAGRDAFVVMPTGGGKSLCYQLPAHLMDGTCLVVSPLISLMKDQVDAALENGLRAAFLNSSQEVDQRREVIGALRRGELDLLYVSPERFAMDEFSALLQDCRLSFVAIDEAHCISEWGHDFRPDYLALGSLTERFPKVPVAAFTATATLKVQEDIVARLKLRDPLRVRASFNRPNLYYAVESKTDAQRQLLRFVLERRGQAGIIYRTTRKSVEETAAYLREHAIRALPYHAGLEDAVRAANQEAFNRDEADVVVATIAFGMGIDKSNVRYVVHGDLPKNIEGYYQETGRSGRDGDPAHCLLLFGYGDIPKIRHFIGLVEDADEKRRAERALQEVVNYATAHACRRRQLLGYFGETLEGDACGACDVCAGKVARVDATRDAQIVLSAIARTGQRFGANHVIDVITGAETERIRALGHDQVKTYGVGADRDKRHWRRVIDNLLAQGLAAQAGDEYPTLVLADRAMPVLKGETPFFMNEVRVEPRARRRKGAAAAMGAADDSLFEALRALRFRLAKEQGVPAYVIFTDRTLHELAIVKPADEDALAGIHGIGARKREQYGALFLEAIRAHGAGASGTS